MNHHFYAVALFHAFQLLQNFFCGVAIQNNINGCKRNVADFQNFTCANSRRLSFIDIIGDAWLFVGTK